MGIRKRAPGGSKPPADRKIDDPLAMGLGRFLRAAGRGADRDVDGLMESDARTMMLALIERARRR